MNEQDGQDKGVVTWTPITPPADPHLGSFENDSIIDLLALKEIKSLLSGLSRVVVLDADGEPIPTLGTSINSVQLGSGQQGVEYQIEQFYFSNTIGIRATEGGVDIENCADACSILVFGINEENGSHSRVEVSFVADGVGQTILGDIEAKILVNKAQEYCIQQVKSGLVKSRADVELLLPAAVAYADAYFHSLSKAVLRKFLEKRIANLPTLQQDASLKTFDEGKIASSTILGLAVSENIVDFGSVDIVYLAGGDGGLVVTAGDATTSTFIGDFDYATAPEQVNYGKNARTVQEYRSLISSQSIERPADGSRIIVSVMTDWIEKLKRDGKKVTSDEIANFCREITQSQDPLTFLASLLSQVGDDATFLQSSY